MWICEHFRYGRSLKLAAREDEVGQLDTYMRWAQLNGLEEGEVEMFDARQVEKLEPHVRCAAALHAKKETVVDFGAFTKELRNDAASNGVKFLMRRRVLGLSSTDDGVQVDVEGSRQPHEARYVVNCAGGDAVDLAHSLGVGLEYTDLHFRGEYWSIKAEFGHLASRNIYTVPRHPEYPFLDPHWIIRASGGREIGPNAVPVDGPWTYYGFYEDLSTLFQKAWEPPLGNKARLLFTPTFLSLALKEVLGSISKAILTARVRRFLPGLREDMLLERGTAGVRSSLIDRRGYFIGEVLELEGSASTHVLNYNSPGATGAPAYTASLMERLEGEGHLEHLRTRSQPLDEPWSFEEVVAAFDWV